MQRYKSKEAFCWFKEYKFKPCFDHKSHNVLSTWLASSPLLFVHLLLLNCYVSVYGNKIVNSVEVFDVDRREALGEPARCTLDYCPLAEVLGAAWVNLHNPEFCFWRLQWRWIEPLNIFTESRSQIKNSSSASAKVVKQLGSSQGYGIELGRTWEEK